MLYSLQYSKSMNGRWPNRRHHVLHVVNDEGLSFCGKQIKGNKSMMLNEGQVRALVLARQSQNDKAVCHKCCSSVVGSVGCDGDSVE